MGEKKGIFLVSLFNFLIFIGLINYVFDISGLKFVFELLFVLALLSFAAISVILIYNKISAGYAVSSVVSALALVNLLFFYFRMEISNILFLAIISAITLFVMSISGIAGKPKEEMHVPKPPVYLEKYNAGNQPAINKPSPNKFVTSRSANYYHVPGCDAAKQIKANNRIYYDSEAEAKKKGLKAHNCIKR